MLGGYAVFPLGEIAGMPENPLMSPPLSPAAAPRIAVLIPCYNEEVAIPAVVAIAPRNDASLCFLGSIEAAPCNSSCGESQKLNHESHGLHE